MQSIKHYQETKLPYEAVNLGVDPFTGAPATIKEKRVVFIDTDDMFLKRTSYRLKQSGFSNFAVASCIEDKHYWMFDDTDLVVADYTSTTNFDALFSAFELAKFRGYRGKVVLMSEEAPCSTIYSAAMLGVSDFWIKGSSLKIDKELIHILSRKPVAVKEKMCPQSVANLGFFRSVGLTKGETALIAQMADGFPRQCDIASRLNRNPTYIHKVFSRIYEKLKVTVDVDNPTQLAFLITVCSMFR